MYGDCTRCHNPENRAREIAIRAICYSVEPAARSHAKDQRSAIGAVFVALKKMYGDCTRCRNPENRAREIAIRAICYSVEPAARSHAKDGRLTPEMIATTAA